MANIKYFTEEQRRIAKNKAAKKWRDNNPEKSKKSYTTWQKEHPMLTRANRLLQLYKLEDRKHNRGKGDLSRDWIVDNIFTKPCAHCGKTGWQVIGCNRLDNTKPHTMDNVEPCCYECNCKLAGEASKTNGVNCKPFDQIDPITGEVVKTWVSTKEAERCGFHRVSIRKSCNENNKVYKGYFWKWI